MAETVLLLPGLGSPGWSMSFIASRLRRDGFDTVIIPYKAAHRTLSEVVSDVSERIEALPRQGRVHLLGHSMGGLVARGVACRGLKTGGIGRIVMIGTPLMGSGIAARMATLPISKLPYGRLWRDLSPEGCLGNRAAIPGVEVGMIAGAVPGGRIFGGMGTDGIVPVAATMSEGLDGHVTVPASHALLLLSGQVADAASRFLRTGTLD